jgi:hypothetical protein
VITINSSISYNPPPSIKGALLIKKWTKIIRDMNLFPNEENVMRNKIASWKAYANSLNSEGQKNEFEEMLNNYCIYAQIIIDAGCESFPSKSLVMNLLFFQYRKIMLWLMNKTARN